MEKDKLSCVRLDKWLWAARLYKTRSLAREMAQGGKVHVNGHRAKASKQIEVNASITLWQGVYQKTIVVTGLAEKRVSASLAQDLYQETEQSVAQREQLAVQRKLNAATAPHPERRPDKKQRRDLLRVKKRQSDA